MEAFFIHVENQQLIRASGLGYVHWYFDKENSFNRAVYLPFKIYFKFISK